MGSSKEKQKSSKKTRKSLIQTRQLVPVFAENMASLYVLEDGKYTSLAELQALAEESAEIPGLLTTSINKTSSAEGGTTITTALVSPYKLCCRIVGGTMYCWICP